MVFLRNNPKEDIKQNFGFQHEMTNLLFFTPYFNETWKKIHSIGMGVNFFFGQVLPIFKPVKKGTRRDSNRQSSTSKTRDITTRPLMTLRKKTKTVRHTLRFTLVMKTEEH